MPNQTYLSIDGASAAKYLVQNSKTLILDFRDVEFFEKEHFKTAKHLTIENLNTWITKNQAKKNQPILVHCGAGVRSPQACKLLVNTNFTNIICAIEGYKVIKPIYDKLKAQPKFYSMTFAAVYKCYLDKVMRKNKTKQELDQVIFWLTGYNSKTLQTQIDNRNDFQTFFEQVPKLNPNASKITGVICGYRVEDIKDPLIQKVRYLDKLVDELANGKAMEKILRQ